MTRFRFVCLAAAALLLAPAAGADAFKCRSPDGRVVISSEPCTAGSRTETVTPAEKISPEQKAEAEKQLAREREALAERERLRDDDARRDQDSQRRLAEEESARRSRCLESAQREPDATQRANLIAACQGAAPASPAVAPQPVYVPVVPVRPHNPRDACPGGRCPPPSPPPPATPPPSPSGGRYAPSADPPRKNCQPVGGTIRCD